MRPLLRVVESNTEQFQQRSSMLEYAVACLVEAICYSRQVVGWIYEVTEYFKLPHPSSHNMTLGFSESRTEMSTIKFLRG
jgi:hypothetical protein